MATGIVQLLVGVFAIAIAQYRLEQQQVDAYVRSKQAFDEALGRRVRPAGEIEQVYRRSQWAIAAIGIISVIVGAGFCGAAYLSA